MLRSLMLLACCFVAAANVFAQTIVPVEREPVYTKEDIFDRLTPLAPAKPLDSAATEKETVEPSTSLNPAREEIIEPSPATTVRVREPAAPSPAPRAEQPALSSQTARTATSAELSPKLQALLKPIAQSEGQRAKVPAHTPGALTALSADELRTLIAHVAQQFDKELASLNNGERWRNYLKLDELEAACQAGADEGAIEPLPEIGKRFVALAGDADYAALTKRSAFQTLNIALGEFLSLDDQRAARQQLLASSDQLHKSLAAIGTGSQWTGYFELTALQRLAVSTTPVSDHDLVQLQLLLSRFEQAATDAKYAGVAKLDGFAATRDSLRNILGVAQRPTGPAVDLSISQLADGGEASSEDEEFTVPDDASSPPAQAAAVERLPQTDLQLVALEGKAFLRKPSDPAWKQIGTATASVGDTIAARDEAAQVVLGEGFALQLAQQTTLSLASRGEGEGAKTSLALEQGTVKAIASARGEKGQTLHLSRGDYELAVSGDDFAVEFRIEKQDGRVIAIVHAGEAAVINKATGDRAVVCAGREAVLLASGIALRGAPTKTANWWTSPDVGPRSARRQGGGFSR